MTKEEYKAKLLDVRWQQRRLDILQKDGWSCRSCATKKGSFHVHHLWYECGRDPWDYPDEALVTLCSNCHQAAPGINWKQAFLDLNLTERELLEMAMELHYLKNKWTVIMKDLTDKYKCRFFNLTYHFALLESSEDLDDFWQNHRKAFKDKYTNGV